MKKMTIEEAINYMDNDDSYKDFAVRGDDYIPKKSFRKSRYHGDETKSYQLPGVSAIVIPNYTAEYLFSAACSALSYGDHVFLISGEQQNADVEYNDPDEVIILNNKIVAEIIL